MKKKRTKILYVAGARPNFMKIFPLLLEGKRSPTLNQVWVHTGQHYDPEMTSLFFRQFQLPREKYRLKVGSGSHAEQTARVLERFDKVLLKENPDWVVVVGDVNSTLAATLAAVKRHIPVAHVEAGLRSFDRTMPEEINRLLTDQIADLLFIPSQDAKKNLLKEGVDPKKICFVGNIMIDALRLTRPQWKTLNYWEKLELKPKNYFLLTLHRPHNVDLKLRLSAFLNTLNKIQQKIPVVFPIHPRTQASIRRFSFQKRLKQMKNLHLVPPHGYFQNMSLMSQAAGVLTDSGGMQEECTYLHVPCLTLRPCTERPITVTQGTNRVVDLDEEKILKETDKILSGRGKNSQIPLLWDGKTASRILKIFKDSC